METLLRYDRPAAEWKEGLPVGNGRLGGMLYGTEREERLGLNHEWLYTGRFREREIIPPPDGALQEVRRLLYAGELAKGTDLANRALAPTGGVSGTAPRVDPFQPAGDVYFSECAAGEISNYRRELDLETGVASVTYECGGVGYKREVFASHGDGVIAVRLSSSGGPLGAAVRLGRVEDGDCTAVFRTRPCGAGLSLYGEFSAGGKFLVNLRVYTAGAVAPLDGGLRISGADEAVVLVNIGTNLTGGDFAREAALPEEIAGWSALLARHLSVWKEKFGRVSLELASNGARAREEFTDKRLEALKRGEDGGVAALYFNFARYLLLSSSGELPAHLQGIWNDLTDPPWQCDFHNDVNLQMNYWMAEPAAMGEAAEALFGFMERLVPSGREAAQKLYGCRGIVFPIQTDAWGRATLEAMGWAVWTGAAPWLALHMWQHYEYTLDRGFLARRAYPFIKECALFYEDYLEADGRGVLQLCPSQSPENRLANGGDMPVTLCVSAAMDVELCAFTLEKAAKCAEILQEDAKSAEKWREMLALLPELRLGADGCLLEFGAEVEEAEPGHRHVSHLLGAYPGEEFNAFTSPALFEGARRSLEKRLAFGGGHTGWSRAWTACLYARFGDGERAWEHLTALICDFATVSLLDLHPPRIFQIDGNLGGGAAVCELLLQSVCGKILLLPALPKAWPVGKISGLRAKGGFEVDMEWAGGRLAAARIRSRLGGTLRLEKRCLSGLTVDGAYEDGGDLCVETAPGGVYAVK